MATIIAYHSMDMDKDEQSFKDSRETTIAEKNHIQASDGIQFINFYGSFNFINNTGTVTELNLYENENKIYEVLQLNIDITELFIESLSEEQVDTLIMEGNDTFTGSNEYDYFKSYAGDDSINAKAGNDIIYAGTGNDIVNGGEGIDTAIFTGDYGNYTVTETLSGLSISGTDGSDLLTDIERLHFDDINIAFDVDGNAGQAYRIYKAAFDRIPDSAGLGFWIDSLDNGVSMLDIAAGFTNSAEFISLYGSETTNAEFINLLYNNVLDRNADQAGLDFWLGNINSGLINREGVLIEFSESAENQANTIGLIASGIEYTNWI